VQTLLSCVVLHYFSVVDLTAIEVKHIWYLVKEEPKPDIQHIEQLIKTRALRGHGSDECYVELKADLWKYEYGRKICGLANYCNRLRLQGKNRRCFFIGGYDEKSGPMISDKQIGFGQPKGSKISAQALGKNHSVL